MQAFATESQASLSHGSFLPGRLFAVVLISSGLQVGLLYAAAYFEKKFLRYLVRDSCSDREDLDKYVAHKTRDVIYDESLVVILLSQARPFSPRMGCSRETEWKHSREGSKKQRPPEAPAAVMEQGWRHQTMEIIRGLLPGRHMALAPSSCLSVTTLLQMVHFTYSLHHRIQKRFIDTVEMALMCALQNLPVATGIPPKAKPASVSRHSDESTSMGNYRETEPKNISDSNSKVATHDVINAVAKTAATWLVASAATHHATGNRDLLSGFKTLDDIYIQAGDGVSSMPVRGCGSVITEKVVLPDVWFVPGLTDNIVSASQLIELDYSVGFTRGVCYIRGATDDTVIGEAPVGEDGKFQLKFLQVN